MEEKSLYDINEVCRMLETTSRTLRFYEEKGVIESTKIPFSSRRHYTLEQIDRIRDVMALRTLGLSLKSIMELKTKGTQLKSAVLARRAEMIATIESKNKEIRILNEALEIIEAGGDIFENSPEHTVNRCNTVLDDIAKTCSEGIVLGNSEDLYAHLSAKMIEYMPASVYEAIRSDTLQPIGAFVAYDRIEHDDKYPNVIYHYIKYEKLGLKIKYVFHNRKIAGLWLGYYEMQ